MVNKMDKKILIAILAIIIIILGLFVFSHPMANKLDSQITFLSDTDLENGDQVEIQLTDEKGNALTDQMVNFTLVENGEAHTYSAYTDANGKAYLVLNDENPGDYEITVTFGGSDQLNPCTAKQTIKIGDDDSENTSSNTNTPSTSSNSSSGQTHYDTELNEHYDDNGVIQGGQNDGMDINEVKNNVPQIDEEGLN